MCRRTADLGPWDAHPLAEATLRPDRYSADAGIRAVLDAADGETGGRIVDLVISGAAVAATGLTSPTEAGLLTFWIADAKGAMMAFKIVLPFDPTSLRVGDLVDMRVLGVEDFFGVLEITEAQIQPTGVRASVFVEDAMTGDQLMYKAYPQEMIEVWGELVRGPAERGADCFDLATARPTPCRSAWPRAWLSKATACTSSPPWTSSVGSPSST